jgi:hypothetical protein
MTISALLMGFAMGFAGAVDRDEMAEANKEDKEIYGSLAANYQSAYMSTSFIGVAFNAVTLFSAVTTYVAYRHVKPSTDTEATLFYDLFDTEMKIMYAALYLSGFFMCVAGYYLWTIKSRPQKELQGFFSIISSIVVISMVAYVINMLKEVGNFEKIHDDFVSERENDIPYLLKQAGLDFETLCMLGDNAALIQTELTIAGISNAANRISMAKAIKDGDLDAFERLIHTRSAPLRSAGETEMGRVSSPAHE